MKYSCATRYTTEIPSLFGNSVARDVCTTFCLATYPSVCLSVSLLSVFFSVSLLLSLYIAPDERKRRPRDLAEGNRKVHDRGCAT